MKKVQVLLSSYNGEKYIKEQLDSILSQTYDNISILVRDDGSTDETVTILRKYETEGKIRLVAGKNCGFIQSFHWLVAHADDADYYAFSDQDDIWFPEKISRAVEKLEELESELVHSSAIREMPLLYFSNYDFYDDTDGEMKYAGHAYPLDKVRKPSFYNAIVDCMPLGFCSVMNYAAKRMMTEHIPSHSCGHDWWTYLLCSGLGRVVYDSRPTVKYRRTGNNVSAGGMAFLSFQIWRIRKFFLQGYFQSIRMMLAEFYYLYSKALREEDQKQLSLYARKNVDIIANLVKAFYPRRYREHWSDEVMLRICILIGQL